MSNNLTKQRSFSWRRIAPAGACLLLAIGVAACGSSSASSSSSPGTAKSAKPVGAAANTVTLKLVAIHPAAMTVAVGTTVTWKQMDPGFHTVTSGTVEQGAASVTTKPDGQFASGQLATGKTFSHTFSTPGTYPYFCEIHPATMRGVITVK